MFKNRFFLILIAFLFLILCIPKEGADRLRWWAIHPITPLWSFFNPTAQPLEKEKLELENQLLHAELDQLKTWFLEATIVEKQQEYSHCLAQISKDPFFERRKQYLSQIVQRHLVALPAKVIFREPANWSSSIWLNVGERDNRVLSKEIVAKNSPVVIGKTVVGVVEAVEEAKCRVRLITDQSLHISVRAIRKGEQNRVLYNQLDEMIKGLTMRQDLYGAEEIARILATFQKQFNLQEKELYLAKGILHGSSRPLWRTLGQTLKGFGFNYDFSDEEGGARDLRTGMDQQGRQVPLICIGDLLVTTGMDGIFPPDLNVAIVSKIHPLHEGGCSYELEAKTLLTDLNTFREVFVLPPR